MLNLALFHFAKRKFLVFCITTNAMWHPTPYLGHGMLWNKPHHRIVATFGGLCRRPALCLLPDNRPEYSPSIESRTEPISHPFLEVSKQWHLLNLQILAQNELNRLAWTWTWKFVTIHSRNAGNSTWWSITLSLCVREKVTILQCSIIAALTVHM